MLCLNCGHDNIAGIDLCEACGTDLAGLDLPEAHSDFRGKILTGRVGDLELKPAPTVPLGATVTQAIEKMRRARQGCVLVVGRNGGLKGIFTERDVLVRVVARGLVAGSTPVEAVMTPDPMVVWPSDPPAYAIHRMVEQSVRHLPVVDGSRVLGFISSRSILRYIGRDVLGRAAV